MKLLLTLALTLAPSLAQAKPESLTVDPAKSTLQWEATKIGGDHHGQVKVQSGKLLAEKGAIVGGQIMMEMNTIEIGDEMSSDMKMKLLNHLKSDDFFSVAKHPTATLKVDSVSPLKDGKQTIKGQLTIKGITKPTEFPVTVTKNGKKLTAKADFQVDRTLYDIKYRSLKFFSDLGDKVIHDKFTLKANLETN